MDLPYALKLLAAADEQPYGFIKLRGAHADQEVRCMVEVGLVEATLSDGGPGSFTCINRVTDLGEMFLRVFPERSIPRATLPAPGAQPATGRRSYSPTAGSSRRAMNFALALKAPKQAPAKS